jgi:3-isopropylmalate/(R)-2-methylmalate dehydratase small subunit
MEKFVRLSAKACPCRCQTSTLIKSCRRAISNGHDRKDWARFFFRIYVSTATETRKDFPLNQPGWKNAKILLAGRNFGGGSSREAAVYALYDYGFRCVVAPSFGDIFAQNAVKNGLLTAIVSDADIADMAAAVSANPDHPIVVDLEGKTIACGNRTYAFEIDPVSRNQLLNGWDDVDLTESYRDRIAKFSTEHRALKPWVVPARD